MNREYHKWHSNILRRDMELLVFGTGGTPVLVFPTSMGRFYDYEDRRMIAAVGHKYETGQLQAFCVDSVDSESWYDKRIHPSQRAVRHNEYDQYLVEEVVPFIRARNQSPGLITTGCSFGGYHTINFALRHPDIVTDAVSMGGAFDIHDFLNGYYDDNCYYNCPPDFVPGLSGWYLDHIRHQRLVLATGENDICRDDNVRMSRILDAKQIPHYLDVWLNGTGHDWPWWEQMAQKFL